MSIERPVAPNPYDYLPPVETFTVSSTDLVDGTALHDAQVQHLGNTSPHLSWEGAPAGTQSYVVSCFDPDAPTPCGFWHWCVVDIPVEVTSLDTGAAAGKLPPGAFHVRNDGGEAGYMGAAPPQGDHPHRYFFVVHAVKDPSLGVDERASNAVVSFNLAFKTLGRALIHATYQY